MDIYKQIKKRFETIIESKNIEDSRIKIRTKALSAEESIGNPIHEDYPLIKGDEKLLQAEYKGARGVAFTDMYGNFEGKLKEILNLELTSNYRRAIFIATVNAVLRWLDILDDTEHCRDEGPVNCKENLTGYIRENFKKNPKILLVGHQPRFAEELTAKFNARIVDRDKSNVGKEVNNIKIQPEEKTNELIDWADLLFVTGSTFVNDTAGKFLDAGKPISFYGVTGAGPTYLLDLKRYCTEGR